MHTESRLTSFNIDKDQISVSGLSAGGYMAVQMHIAHSSQFMGAAIFAAGPYFCSQGQKHIADHWCMQTELSPPDTVLSVHETMEMATSGQIDLPLNLCDDRVFIQSGTRDVVVKQEVSRHLARYYHYFVKQQNIKTDFELEANHCMPVNKTDKEKLKPCSELGMPFIGMCDYDGAGVALGHIYGTESNPLNPPSVPDGDLIAFSQKEFFGDSHTLHDTGYIYVPSSTTQACPSKLHIVFHGCLQSPDHMETDFCELSGYNEWAETNNIIVLYPQVKNIPEVNTAACWDWWGYESPCFHTKNGTQIMAVMKMIRRITG